MSAAPAMPRRFERDPGNRWLRETIMELFVERA